MMKTTPAHKFSVGLIPTTLILAALTLGFIMLVVKNQNVPTVNKIGNKSMDSRPAIKGTDDLNAALTELDDTDTAVIDQELKSLSSDTSTF